MDAVWGRKDLLDVNASSAKLQSSDLGLRLPHQPTDDWHVGSPGNMESLLRGTESICSMLSGLIWALSFRREHVAYVNISAKA